MMLPPWEPRHFATHRHGNRRRRRLVPGEPDSDSEPEAGAGPRPSRVIVSDDEAEGGEA